MVQADGHSARPTGNVDRAHRVRLIRRSIVPMVGGPVVLLAIAAAMFVERLLVSGALTLGAAAFYTMTISRAHYRALRTAAKVPSVEEP